MRRRAAAALVPQPTAEAACIDVFYEITALLLLTAAGAVAVRLRQPLILAFIGVGVAVGPAGLGWIEASEQVELALGNSLLLFVVGLKLDLHVIRRLGAVALATGLPRAGNR